MNRLIAGSSAAKSRLLLQYMAETYREGFLLIDPTGVTAEAAADGVPKHLTEKTFYLDPNDVEYPAGFNVLESIPSDARHALAENICAYFEGMFPNGWGAQSNFILLNCLRVLLDTPGSTLLGISPLLTNNQFRTKCLSHCTDPAVLSFWRMIFDRWPEQFRLSAIAPLQNKIGAFVASPLLRNILGQRTNTFSLARGKIIIANLDRRRLGDQTSRLLAGLLLARSQGHVILSDLGFLSSDYLATMLAQNRFTVSFTFLHELTPKLQKAALAVDDKAVFRTSIDDAQTLAFGLPLDNPRILTELGPHEAFTSQGYLAPAHHSPLQRIRAIRKRSRACHTRGRAAVERVTNRIFA